MILSTLLGFEVKPSRVQVAFDVGDCAIAFVLKRRLAEGQILKTVEEVQQIGYDLFYVSRTGW